MNHKAKIDYLTRITNDYVKERLEYVKNLVEKRMDEIEDGKRPNNKKENKFITNLEINIQALEQLNYDLVKYRSKVKYK